MTADRPPRRPVLWVVGAGGLLGSEVVAAARRANLEVRPATGIRWHDPDLAAEDVARAAAEFVADAGARPWQVAWCGGAGVTGSTSAAFEAEGRVFGAALDALSTRWARPGTVFLASSAGGVYAGSAGAPFDETSIPVPLSPYGEAKLAQEQALRRWARESGASALVGRIANLYGPGQDLSKAQGLISHVCLAQLTRRPISIYVPLDTLRHYLFAPDCGEMVVAGLTALQTEASERGPQWWVKIMTSREPTSIAFVLAELNRILKRRPLVVHGSSPTARFQSTDLRLRSVVHPDIAPAETTSLVVGMSITLEGMQRTLAQGRLG